MANTYAKKKKRYLLKNYITAIQIVIIFKGNEGQTSHSLKAPNVVVVKLIRLIR